jgi:hypothetical protein
VARSLVACAEALAAEGYVVDLERWEIADGKGIDDVLAAGKTPEIIQGQSATQAIRAIAAKFTAPAVATCPGDELDRLVATLETDGAEGLFRDKELLRDLAQLAEGDPAEFACVRARVERGNVRLRDLDKVLAPLRQEIRRQKPRPESAGCYRVVGGRIIREVLTKDGAIEVSLCNFDARIVEQIVHDDGAEQRRSLAVEGSLADGTPLARMEVLAADFNRMDWPVSEWGTRAVVFAGMGTKDHLRCALQLISGEAPERTIYGHTGWRQVSDAWHYLHAGGALGPAGPSPSVAVALPQALAGYCLPDPIAGPEQVEAVRAGVNLATLGPDRLMFPILAAVYRSVLGPTDFSLHLAGSTGTCKTETAALAQQHFGAGLDARHLPGSWASTGNALEALAFAAKDALLVVDDFCPAGSTADVQRYHREADRIFRAQGNAAGRSRMRADASLRPAKPPRGTILSTGEDTPRGQSLRARLFVLEFSPGDIDRGRLAPYQADAGAGKYALALAGFIRWLAPQYEAIRTRLKGEMVELRAKLQAGDQHARTPGIVADLALGFKYFLAFALEVGALTKAEGAEWNARAWSALQLAAAEQADHVLAADPATHCIRLLAGALASGRAHIAGTDGTEPENATAWGWRQETVGTGEHQRTEWQAQGRRIGWLGGEDLYLEPEAAYAEAQELARHQGESLAVGARTLWKRLRTKGLLANWDQARQRNTVRRTLEGVRDREVIHLRSECLSGIRPSEPSAADPDDGRRKEIPDGSCGRSQNRLAEPSAETVHPTPCLSAETSNGGRFGRSDAGREKEPIGNHHAEISGWGEL